MPFVVPFVEGLGLGVLEEVEAEVSWALEEVEAEVLWVLEEVEADVLRVELDFDAFGAARRIFGPPGRVAGPLGRDGAASGLGDGEGLD